MAEIPPIKVRIETDVVMDVELMAKAFAHMGSAEQAKFLALAYREMATFTRDRYDGTHEELGEWGRETQLCYLKDEFNTEPDARRFVADLFELDCGFEIDTNWESGKGYPKIVEETSVGVVPNDRAIVGYNAAPVLSEDDKAARAKAEQEYLDDLGCWPKTHRTALKVHYTQVEWPTGDMGRPAQVVCTCKVEDPLLFNPGDVVALDVDPSEHRLGQVTKIDTDGFIDVLLDPIPRSDLGRALAHIQISMLESVEQARTGLDRELTKVSLDMARKADAARGFTPDWAHLDRAVQDDKTSQCSECGGDGEVTLFNGVVPCSRGCKP